MIVLKEEINNSLSAIGTLARWRLFVVSTLAAIGLGIDKDMAGFEHGYLLLFFAPFVCAYVDFLVYERVSVVFEIAKYLRNYDGQDKETRELQKYERFVHDRRKRGISTGYQRWAHYGMSLCLAVLVPGLALAVPQYQMVICTHPWSLAMPVFGIIGVVLAFTRHLSRLKETEG
ncbi:MAG: hypothetical protein ACRER2_06655 [Methylococcales bacterium]